MWETPNRYIFFLTFLWIPLHESASKSFSEKQFWKIKRAYTKEEDWDLSSKACYSCTSVFISLGGRSKGKIHLLPLLIWATHFGGKETRSSLARSCSVWYSTGSWWKVNMWPCDFSVPQSPKLGKFPFPINNSHKTTLLSGLHSKKHFSWIKWLMIKL